jgi:hypothetical protein
MTTTRQAIHTFVAVFTATAVITGCKPAPRPAPAPAPEAPGGTWGAVVTNTGYAIVLKDKGEDRIRLACARQPSRFVVWIGGFDPVASEERLSVGFDDHVTALVAQSTAPGPGVDAEAAIPMKELETLLTAKTVGASYGSQTVTARAPDRQLADAFVVCCRQAVADAEPREPPPTEEPVNP